MNFFGDDSIFSELFGSGFDVGNRTEYAEEYEEASGVDLIKQREIWDERAKGYWGEYKVFAALFGELDFPSKILVNVEIPADNGRTTEIDLMLFDPSGIYVFEIKHFSGVVYGGFNSPTWTEYYKTRDSVTFGNPLKQNEYHLRQLRRLLPEAKFYSYVVFTNPRAEIKVGGRYPGNLTVCRLEDLQEKIRSDFATREELYTPEQIEALFTKVRPYSPLEVSEKEFFTKDEDIIPFSGFAEAMLGDLKREKQRLQEEAEAEVQRRTATLEAERADVKILGDGYRERIRAAEKKRDETVLKIRTQCEKEVEAANAARDEANHSLAEFAKNFETVQPYASDKCVINRDCFKADVQFYVSDSFVNTTNISFTLRNVSHELWFETENAWFLIGLKNGTVQKYVLKDHIESFRIGSKIEPQCQKYGSPCRIRLFNVAMEDINYIKMGNVGVMDRSHGRGNIAPGIEFEIYVAPGVETVYKVDEPAVVGILNDGAFELNPDFVKYDFSVDSSADGKGCDIRFCFAADTAEIGFDLQKAMLLIGTQSGFIGEYGLKQHVRNFYSTSVMPLSKTNIYTMHMEETTAEDIVFIKLKGLRVFRKEYWQNENILPDAVFDVYPKETSDD